MNQFGKEQALSAPVLPLTRAGVLKMTVWVWRNQPGWPVEYVSEDVRMWGYDPDTFLSGALMFDKLVHPEDLAKVQEEVSRHADETTCRDFGQSYRLLAADGTIRQVEDRTWVERDSQGNALRFQGVLVDITDLRETHNRLQEQMEELHRWHRATLGRESRVLELKQEVNHLLCELHRKPRYQNT